MSHRNLLILQVHLAVAQSYELGDEIWQQPLAYAIRRRGSRVIAELTAALQQSGDT